MVKNKLVYLCGVAIFLATPVSASMLNIINENEKPIKVKIVADKDPSAIMRIRISRENKSTIKVDREHLNGTSVFSITGDTNPFTVSGSCSGLSVEHDYNIKFTNDKVGTSCISELIE